MTLTGSSEPQRAWALSPYGCTLALSLVIHLVGAWMWVTAPDFLRRHKDQLPEWMRRALVVEQPVLKKPEAQKDVFQPRPDEYEIPLSFIEVDPSLAVTQAPKDAPFQSTANTVAQNVAAPKPELKQPFIGGTQEKFPKLFEVEKPKPKAEAQPKELPKV